jgi:rhomboid family GlyGly-CTERM serine protease
MRRTMITAPPWRESFTGLRMPLALAGVMVLLALGGAAVADALAYGRDALAAGQWWRALSGHFVHLGAVHATLNLAGLAALLLLCPERPRAREWLRRIVVLALTVSMLLYLAAPDVDRYVGFSGVLHGLFVLGLVPMARSRDRIALAVLLLLAIKLTWEHVAGPSAQEARLIGGGVVTVAHLFGTLAALVYGFAFGTFRRGEESQ